MGRKGGQARRRPGLGGEGRLCPGRVVPVLPGPGAVLRPGGQDAGAGAHEERDSRGRQLRPGGYGSPRCPGGQRAHPRAGTGGVGEGPEGICSYRFSARPPDRRMEGRGGAEQPGVGRPGHRLRHLAGAGHPGGPAVGAQACQRGRAGEGPGKEALRGGVLRPGGQEARQADSGAGERQAPALFAGRGGLFGG